MRIASIISLTLLLFFNSVSAQKVKRVKEKIKLGTARYTVLKSDSTIKHGKYKEIVNGSYTLMISGQYEYGKKNGSWVRRHPGGSLISKGNFLNDKRVGKWVFYDIFNKIIQEYDYDTKTLVWSRECEEDKEYETLINGDFIRIKLDCPPSIIGGTIPFSQHLTSKFGLTLDDIKYKNRYGLYFATVSILINKDGTVGDMKSVDPINKELQDFLENEINDEENK